MLIEPFLLSAARGVDADEADPHRRRTKSVEEPLGTVHAGGGNFGIVEPFVFSRYAEGASRSIDEPTPTQVAKHSHVLISPYYRSGSGETCTQAEAPLPTVTLKGRFGMVVLVTQTNGGAAARDVADPVPTMTTAKGGEFAVVIPLTHHDGSDWARDTAVDPIPTKGPARSDRRAEGDAMDHYRNLTACLDCALKPRCTPAETRRVNRWVHEGVLDAMQARLDRMPDAMKIRRQTMEHPFGTLKAWMGATHFLTWTLAKVRTEMSLQVLAYNMKRMIQIFGVGPLMEAIRA